MSRKDIKKVGKDCLVPRNKRRAVLGRKNSDDKEVI
jgi:hypothetical protein